MAEEQRPRSDAAGARVRHVLEHERAGPFAEGEPPPPGVEGPARLRIERLERIEAGIGEAAEAVGAERNGHPRPTPANGIGGERDGERARRARGRDGRLGAVDAERLRHHGRGRGD